jgi:hypothetical protein
VTRESWESGPEPATQASGWRGLADDDLLHWIESLKPGHGHDGTLLEIIGSRRHFYIRQEAAKKIESTERLKEHSDDRHIGQILARRLARAEDVGYLEQLVRSSRHLEVRNAAEAQLRRLTGKSSTAPVPTVRWRRPT